MDRNHQTVRTAIMATFLTEHGNGFRYQRAVPDALQPFFEGQRLRTVYLGAVGRTAALARARDLAARDDRLFAALKKLSSADREALRAWQAADQPAEPTPPAEILPASLRNAILTTRARLAARATTTPPVEPLAAFAAATINLEKVAPFVGFGGEFEPNENDPEDVQAAVQARRRTAKLKTELRGRQALLGKLGMRASTEQSIWRLVELWEKVQQPRNKRTPERARHAIQHFVDVVGDVDVKTIGQQHFVQFRDHLATAGLSENTQIKRLDYIRAVLAVAVSEGAIAANPAAGIKVRKAKGKYIDRQPRKPFTGAQVRTILEKAESTRFGGERHAAVLWVIKLAAYQGARVGEICQLRKEDVRIEDGVPLIHIHDGHGSVKNASSVRKVPLHPLCKGFLEYATKALGPWVFDFTEYEEGARSGWMSRNFPTFRKNVCGIPDEANVTFHSLRHRWVDAAREVEMPLNIRRSIVGHTAEKGTHGEYGEGVSLRKRAKWIAKVNPLS